MRLEELNTEYQSEIRIRCMMDYFSSTITIIAAFCSYGPFFRKIG